jgi:hypothetical protein
MERLATARAQWVMQISEAIESAQGLAWQLRTSQAAAPEARRLYGQLETLRLELLSLREAGHQFGRPAGSHWLAGISLAGEVDIGGNGGSPND